MVAVIPSLFFVPTQEKITIVQFDQYYELLSNGNMNATWDITIIPEEGVKSMLLHVFFSQKAFINNVVVTDSEGSLTSKMVTGEGLPIIEITFRKRLSPGAEYHFTCNLEVWKAMDIGETEGSFTMLTGYNFPVETLNITAVLPQGTRLRNHFPADGKVSSGKDITVFWTMDSLPSGFNIQISISFDILSESFADSLFSDGVNLYDLQDFDNAREKFEQAQSIYELLNLSEDTDECSVYLDRIDGLEQGLPVFEEAVALFETGDHAAALTKFEEAQSIYEDHQLGTDEIDDYISKTTTYVEAFAELQKGKTALQEGNTSEAKDYFVKARQLFSQVGDTEMVEQVTSQIEQVTPEETVSVPEETVIGRERRTGFFLVVAAAVIVVAAIIAVLKARKPAPVYTDEEIREEMRQLKARFVYGEINKKDYEKRLAELESKLKEKKQEEGGTD
jgi:tetratricopeptide (TPR) repeat protein